MSMSFIRTMISKDKLHEQNASKEDQHAHVNAEKIASPEKQADLKAASTEIPRRNKSLRVKKGKRSSSIGKLLETGGEVGEKSKKPDRECIVM